MLSIRRVLRVGGAAILLVSGVAVGVLSSSPVASAGELSWSIVPSPNASPAQSNELNAVSCSGPSACIAVGLYDTPGSFPPLAQTLIESWNGSAWSIVPSPNTSPTQYNQLSAVSCSGPSACVAVGYQSSASTVQQTLIESWNGSAWSIVPSPNTSPTQGNLLGGVSCTGPSACVAVGDGGTGQTLIESWNGSAWSIVPSPNTSPTQVNVLQAVSCNLPAACVAVGQYYPLSGDFSQTLIESWNGSAWSIVPSPNTSPTQINLLGGVSCSSPSACTAIGVYEAGISAQQTLIESWNGSTWSIVPSPNSSPTQNNYLTGVSCSSPSACTAVGYYPFVSSDGSASDQALIESWNGSAWSIVPSPTALQPNLLLGVSCSSSSACTAVGDNSSQTLIERGTLSTTTSVLIPSNGATLSGSTYLDAAASNATSVQFWLFGGSYGYSGHLVGTATPTYDGWVYSWNTSTVPNGSYALLSEAFGPGGSVFSSHVSITVNNAPAPTTSVLIPSNGATLSGTAAILDASATNATSVEFWLYGGSYGYSGHLVGTATPTYDGWVYSWNTTTVPNGSYALLSEAFGPGGSAFSSHVSITVTN
jgi:hypothetical protein